MCLKQHLQPFVKFGNMFENQNTTKNVFFKLTEFQADCNHVNSVLVELFEKEVFVGVSTCCNGVYDSICEVLFAVVAFLLALIAMRIYWMFAQTLWLMAID